MSNGIKYDSLEHSQKVTLRTFLKIVSTTQADQLEGEIVSEGAYRIGFALTRAPGSNWFCELNFNGEKMNLVPHDLIGVANLGFVTPFLTFWLEGNVNTVRDDIVPYRLYQDGEGDGEAQLLVFFERVVWRKDDNLYPAQLENKQPTK